MLKMVHDLVHTGFKPEVHGFAFNNTWNLDLPTLRTLKWLSASALVVGAIGLLSRRTGRKQSLFLLVLSTVSSVTLLVATDRARAFAFGLCGGMSFSAVDYFRCGMALPRGT